MPASTLIAWRPAAVAVLLVATSPALAQTQPLPSVEAAPPTASQREALAAFQPHAVQLCRALYLGPNAAESCLRRVLDAALPLDLAPTVAPPQNGSSRPSPGSTVAPDGRE